MRPSLMATGYGEGMLALAGSNMVDTLPAEHRFDEALPQEVIDTLHSSLAGRHPLWVAVTGSRAYGTNRVDSDHDVRGAYMAPSRDFLGLTQPQEQIEREDPVDLTIFEAGKFMRLAAANNPNVMEVLFAPAVHVSPQGKMLWDERKSFLSQRMMKTYGGYAMGQLNQGKKGTGGSRGQNHLKRSKHILHTFRLFIQGEEALRTGNLTVRLNDEQLERVNVMGKLSFEHDFDKIKHHFDEYDAKMRKAAENSPLPEKCDLEALSDLLVRMRTKK